MYGYRPYVREEHVIHIGQRDQQQTRDYGSPDILGTGIHCISLDTIRSVSIEEIISRIREKMRAMDAATFWIHFDTDVMDDKINPAVDYRLPDGLSTGELQQLLTAVISPGKVIGMSVSIYNPTLDRDRSVAATIVSLLATVLKGC
ncbi:MAG: hypothetical protein EOP49_50865 [Sphingobacteriales bacterium]|nr:MAG: hypothetical protein EOP49_50865 [Sphingobacteriales bacterium]